MYLFCLCRFYEVQQSFSARAAPRGDDNAIVPAHLNLTFAGSSPDVVSASLSVMAFVSPKQLGRSKAKVPWYNLASCFLELELQIQRT